MRIQTGLVAMLLLLGVGVAEAQGGCITSPENPTVILGALGSAGALLVTLRRRSRW